jgi:hypothetical protein
MNSHNYLYNTKMKTTTTGESSAGERGEIMYTLGQHARHLNLSFEVDVSQQSKKRKRYWFCDWTSHFVPSPHQNRLVKNAVKEYCEPFRQADLEDMLVGTSTLSSMKEEPLAVRTVMIRIRPDCDHVKVYEALNEAFAVIHPKHHAVLKNADNSFQAIGADGNVPLLLSAQITTSKQHPALERYVLLRFYHVTQVHLLEEVLQKIGGVQNQKSPLQESQTPLNNKLGEACAMLQTIFGRKEFMDILDERQQQMDAAATNRLRGPGGSSKNQQQRFLSHHRQRDDAVSVLHEIPSPKNSTRETSRFFMDKMTESPSVLDENWEKLPVFPSLSNRDYDVLQESWPLLDRIWSELELAKCTYNTLVDETTRFGMRPCQPTLDKDYCIQLFQVSQQRMLQDLRCELDKAENAIHDSLRDYSDFEQQITRVVMRSYNVPLYLEDHNPFNRRDHTSNSLDIGQTPISLVQRDIAEFPWEFDDITLALQDITHTITCVCLEQAYDPVEHSLKIAQRSVEHLFSALEQANDHDQKDFLKRRNRQAMVRLSQQQLYLKEFIRRLSNAPSEWDGLPKLQDAVKRWQEIASAASNKDEARLNVNWLAGANEGVIPSARKGYQVPLLEFSTKFGTACVTQNTIIFLSEMPFFEGSKAFELNKVEVLIQPKNSIHKMAVMHHGKRLLGFTPISMEPEKIENFVRILKSLQT